MPGGWLPSPAPRKTKTFLLTLTTLSPQGNSSAAPGSVSAKARTFSVPGAEPSGYGLGGAGWVTVPLTGAAPAAEVLCDWVEESYRVVAPKRLIAELDGR